MLVAVVISLLCERRTRPSRAGETAAQASARPSLLRTRRPGPLLRGPSAASGEHESASRFQRTLWSDPPPPRLFGPRHPTPVGTHHFRARPTLRTGSIRTPAGPEAYRSETARPARHCTPKEPDMGRAPSRTWRPSRKRCAGCMTSDEAFIGRSVCAVDDGKTETLAPLPPALRAPRALLPRVPATSSYDSGTTH